MRGDYYIGPFAVCKSHVVETTDKVKACPICDSKWTCDFCPNHGEKNIIKEVKTTINSVPTQLIWDKSPEFFDYLCELPTHKVVNMAWYGANQHHPKRKFFMDNYDYGIAWTSSDIDVAAEIEWFKTTFAEQLKLCNELYDSVEITWGCIKHWM